MLEPDREDLICSRCGSEMVPNGTEFVRRELKITPARATVIEYYSVNYTCKGCVPDSEVPVIVKGKNGKAHMMYGMASASTVSWVIKNSDAFFKPMYDFFRRKLLARKFAMADETPVQVLHEPERWAQTKSYMWCSGPAKMADIRSLKAFCRGLKRRIRSTTPD